MDLELGFELDDTGSNFDQAQPQSVKLIEPDWRIARIRLSDKISCLHPRRAATKLGQAHEPEVLVKVREWISALTSPDIASRP